MGLPKRRGYLAERKIRAFLRRYGWMTVRSGGSLGPADIVCLRKGKCILIQVKSTKKNSLYAKGPVPKKIEGFPLYVVVDFGYRNVKVFAPDEKISREGGIPLEEFLEKCEMSF